MKIELKRISYNARLSQETSAYSADIWIDGVKRGEVRNEGHGGPDFIQPFALEKEINDYAKTLPDVEFHGMKLSMDAAMIFGDLLNDHLAAQDLKKAMKGKIVFLTADEKLYTIKGTVAPKDAVKVLNQMPFDEALVLFRAHAKTK